jgi:protocatechuate 3,4-dioxygenase beta subunit
MMSPTNSHVLDSHSNLITLAALIFATIFFLIVPSVSAADDDDAVHIRGRVTDPSGRPVAGARILAVGDWWSFDAPLGKSQSKPDGSYDITFHKSQYDTVNTAWQFTTVAATAPGMGPAWKRWNDSGADGMTDLSLRADDVPIAGQIVDLEGRPVANAMVKIEYVFPTAPDLNSLPISGHEPSETGGNYNAQLPGYVFGPSQSVQTQPDGTFRITGVGRERTAVISVVGPGIAHTSAQVQTRNVSMQTRAFQPDIAANANVRTVYGANPTLTAEPGRTITGTVTDADTHMPLAGVTLKCIPLALKAITDKDGHYRIEGLPKKKDFHLSASPAEDQPYLAAEHAIPPQAGLAPVTLDFQLHRGLWITGKVTDKSTGKPVVHTQINYLPYLSNTYARALPEFHDRETAHDAGVCYTKPDGSFHVVGLPGPALVVAWFSKQPHLHGVGADKVKCPTYNGRQYQVFSNFIVTANGADALADINIPKGAQYTTVNFELDPGVTLHIELVDPSGNPLKGVAVSPASAGNLMLDRRDTSTYDAIGLKPGDKTDLCFLDDVHKLGKVIVVTPTDAPQQNLKLTLEPVGTFTGRLVDADGLPVASARLDAWTSLCTTSTDAQGRFTVTLLPGHEYDLVGVKGRVHFQTDVKKLPVPPGITRDLGDVHMKPY